MQRVDSRDRSSCHLISSLPASLDRVVPAAFANVLLLSISLLLLEDEAGNADVRLGLGRDVATRMDRHEPGSQRHECAALREDHEEAVEAFREIGIFLRFKQLQAKICRCLLSARLLPSKHGWTD